MPVLTKINTNSIAEDAITGDKFAGDAYLSNTANQNISGTYSENRMYTSDAYTLSGNATVNGNLTLSTVKSTGDVVLTASGAYTLTGTGVLSGGSMLAKVNTDASTLTGVLGSAVTGSPTLNLSNATFPSSVAQDYEEGVWHPNNNGGTVTLSYLYARYIRVGKVVHLTCYITLGSNGDSGVMEMGGLPFPPSNAHGGNGHYPMQGHFNSHAMGTGQQVMARFRPNESYCKFYRSGSNTALTEAEVDAESIGMSGTYMID